MNEKFKMQKGKLIGGRFHFYIFTFNLIIDSNFKIKMRWLQVYRTVGCKL
jgi:hypothetical protein